MINFLPISLNMCFGCSKEPSHRDGSFEYPQHIRKIIFYTHSYLGAFTIANILPNSSFRLVDLNLYLTRLTLKIRKITLLNLKWEFNAEFKRFIF